MLQRSRMGTRANTTMAWMTTGLLVITAPFVAFGGLEDPGWEPPPAHVADLDAMEFDATLESDTLMPDTRVGFDSGMGTGDTGTVPPGPADIGGAPRLPDGGSPTPLVEDTGTGCQCTLDGDHGDAGAATSAALMTIGALFIRRRRRQKENGETPDDAGASPLPSGHSGARDLTKEISSGRCA
jgi:MYXO-CTERM domain-containing protein